MINPSRIKKGLTMTLLVMFMGCTADKIPVASIPSPNTMAATDVTRTSATMNGSVTASGSATVTEFGFLLSTDNNLSDARKYAISGDMSSFSMSVTGLDAGSTYFYAVYVTNGISTKNGTIYPINTVSVTAATLSKVTATQTDGMVWEFASSITDNGGSGIVRTGFCYGLNPNPTANDSEVVDGAYTSTDSDRFTAAIGPDEYKPGRTYYVRAYAECDLDGAGSSTFSYSEQTSFTTAVVKPSVETSDPDADRVLSVTAEVGGNVTSDGGADLSAVGIVYSTSENPDIESAVRADAAQIRTGAFSVTLNGLTIETTYFYRAFAINEAGISYGEQKSFVTLEGKPKVTTKQIYRITGVSASIQGEVTDKGTSDITDCGVVWAASENPTIDNFKQSCSTPGTGLFDVTISQNLHMETTYYVRAFATNASGTSYGESLSFQLREDTPMLSIDQPSNITASSADVSASITDDFGLAVIERGFVYSSTVKNPTTADGTSVSSGSGSGSYSSTITGLNPGSTYYVRAYAINSSGEGYSSTVSFRTETSVPSITTCDALSVTENSARLEGEITSDGGEDITSRGFYVGTVENPRDNGRKYEVKLKDLHFDRTFTSLGSKTTYYFVAYASNARGESLGEERSFTTRMERPKVTTGTLSDTTKTSIRCTATATDAGGGTITERGFVLSTTSSPTVNDTKVTVGKGLGDYSSTITNLKPGTAYYIRAYVTNEDWSGEYAQYGEEKLFMTLSSGGTEDFTDHGYEW